MLFLEIFSMNNLESHFVDRVAESCFNLFNKLPKTGKPTEDEWTVLSCIVKHDTNSNDIEVVSLGTGSKCIGATKMSSKGDIMNDSHAEVFARRGFLIYLYDNIEKSLNNRESIFTFTNSKFKLKDQIDFIFYSSQMPCGDASIIPKSEDHNDEDFGHVVQSNKRKAEDSDHISKKAKLEADIYRTGAKCLLGSEQDPKNEGTDYHLLGQVRTKPGRGDRTLSVSCSDKIARWIHLGIQGGLLHMLLEPIYIKHYIFGAGVPYSEESLKRALLCRNNEEISLKLKLQFNQTSLEFLCIRKGQKIRPASGSIIWIKSDKPILEVAIQGKKLGVTKKNASLPSSSLCISKYNLYKKFLSILSKNIDLKKCILKEEDINLIPYNKMKSKSVKYYEEWSKVKDFFFKCWTVKPDMWDFCVSLNT